MARRFLGPKLATIGGEFGYGLGRAPDVKPFRGFGERGNVVRIENDRAAAGAASSLRGRALGLEHRKDFDRANLRVLDLRRERDRDLAVADFDGNRLYVRAGSALTIAS